MNSRAEGENVIKLDKSGRIKSINKATANLLGFKCKECRGKTLPELFSAQTCSTEDLQESEQKRKLERVKHEFLSMAAHDLRTFVHKISFATEIILSKNIEPDKQEELLQLLHRTSEGMIELINDLLDLTKIESGQVSLQKETVDLAPYLEELHISNLILAEKQEVSLEYDLAPDLPEVELDKKRIAQVMNNLISNAIKFSEPEQTVRVQARGLPTGIEISVSDKGPGIQKEDQAQLFKAFWQIGVGGHQKPSGTGLGLAICKKIVEMHEGEIGVDSEVGVGSRFFFRIPL